MNFIVANDPRGKNVSRRQLIKATRTDFFHLISHLLIVGWFSIAEAAAYCSTSKRTIEMWLKEEGLRYSRVRGKRLIKREWLDEFLQKHEIGTAKEVNMIVNEICQDINRIQA